jgi:hypothetical protein
MISLKSQDESNVCFSISYSGLHACHWTLFFLFPITFALNFLSSSNFESHLCLVVFLQSTSSIPTITVFSSFHNPNNSFGRFLCRRSLNSVVWCVNAEFNALMFFMAVACILFMTSVHSNFYCDFFCCKELRFLNWY